MDTAHPPLKKALIVPPLKSKNPFQDSVLKTYKNPDNAKLVPIGGASVINQLEKTSDLTHQTSFIMPEMYCWKAVTPLLAS